MGCPCETRTSTCRSFATISSGLYRFLAIAVLLDVKDIPQVGPLQWGRITHAAFRRRRRQPRRPPLAKIRPGRPAPAMGPGIGAGGSAVMMRAKSPGVE